MALLKLFITLNALFVAVNCQTYKPTWDSLDARPIPKWYDDSKIGIFMHWGVFSVPSYESEWFWNYWVSGNPKVVKFMKDQYPPSFTYQDFAKDFDAYLYDPDWWADLIADSGAKYVVLTSKHHEGYTNWPSNVSFSWNSMDVGPKKDLVGELMKSIRTRTDVHFGLYHSLFEWYNPLYLKDVGNKYATDFFVVSKALPELGELVETYQPEVIWSDGDWLANDTYWHSRDFLAWLYNYSPVKDTVVVNDRWGVDDRCKHGGYWTCQDKYNPGHLIPHKWENAYTLDKASWGYRREAEMSDYLSDVDVITVMAQTISCGGNLLMNIGPRKDGRIDPLMEERLRNMGKWLRINGEAIYQSKPWLYQNETGVPVWYTAKNTSDSNASSLAVYAIILKWPSDGHLPLSNVKPSSTLKITMLGYNGTDKVNWHQANNAEGVIVDFNGFLFSKLPSTIAWVLRFDGLLKAQQRVHAVFKTKYNFN